MVTEAYYPFGYRGTLPDPQLFYGREGEMVALTSKISQGQSVSLVGLYGSGRSSLLKELLVEWPRKPEWGPSSLFTLVFINGGELTSLSNGNKLLPYLAACAAKVSQETSPPTEQMAAGEWLKEQSTTSGRRFVFLLDDFEQTKKIHNIQAKHFTYLRSLVLEANVSFVTATQRSLYDLALSDAIKTSQFFNIFHELPLQVFTEADAQQMVFGRNDERKGLFTMEDFDKLRRLTAWYPLVLNLACGRLYDHRAQEKEVDWYELTEAIIEDTQHDYLYIWTRGLTTTQRNLLRKVHAADRDKADTFDRKDERQLKVLSRMGLIVFDDTNKPQLVPGLEPIVDDSPEEEFVVENTQASADLSQALKDIGEILSGAVLDNYVGYVCAFVANEKDGPQHPLADGTLKLVAGEKSSVIVWFTPEHPKIDFAGRINIRDGNNADDVKFDVSLDSDLMDFDPCTQTILVSPDKSSGRLNFSFSAPTQAGAHDIWISVSQKNRKLQVLRLPVQIEAGGV